jgi:hypothetical protein
LGTRNLCGSFTSRMSFRASFASSSRPRCILELVCVIGTYADVCRRMLTYAVFSCLIRLIIQTQVHPQLSADVC